MSMVFAALLASVPMSSATAAPKYGFGQPATPAQIAGWDIDVRPDGKGLPAGRGSVAAGQRIYDAKCAGCHGTFGESNSYLQIAGGVGSLASDQPVRTTGSKLNYATTLFDYIRRAMPYDQPRTLSNDEVYSVAAFLLSLDGIVKENDELNAKTLPQIRMPNRDGFIPDARPDVKAKR